MLDRRNEFVLLDNRIVVMFPDKATELKQFEYVLAKWWNIHKWHCDGIDTVYDYHAVSCAFCVYRASSPIRINCMSCPICKYVKLVQCDQTPYYVYDNYIAIYEDCFKPSCYLEEAAEYAYHFYEWLYQLAVHCHPKYDWKMWKKLGVVSCSKAYWRSI